MGITILNELQDKLHTIAIAGTNLLSEDFRLKKTAEQFHTIAASSPVLSKIDQLVQHLFDEQNKEKEISLMDAIALVDAVVCTQADYAVKKEDQQDIEIFAKGSIKHIKYTELEPVITALTTTGSGRYDVIYNTYQSKKEFLKDFRILPLLIQGLNDSYSVLAKFIEKILIEVGENVIPLCKKDFDAMGGKDMVHRLNILGEVAKDGENDFYISLLENSSPAIKEKAILNLSYSKKNIDLLIHLVETEKWKYRTAALTALFNKNDKEMISYLLKNVKKEQHKYLPYLQNYNTEEVADFFAEALETALQKLLSKENNEFFYKVNSVLYYMTDKCSKKLIDVFEKYSYIEIFTNHIRQITINYMISKADKKYIAMVKELYKRCGKVYLPCMLLAEFLTEPEKTYDFCLPYFQDEHAIEDIAQILNKIEYRNDGYYITCNGCYGHNGYYPNYRFITKEMDIRWIDTLSQTENNIWKEHIILQRWVKYDNEKEIPLFRRKFRECLKHTIVNSIIFDILKNLGETDFKTLVFSFISNCSYKSYCYSTTINLLKELPFTAEDRIAETKMILQGAEKYNDNSSEQLESFKQELQGIINKLQQEQGKEV